MRFSESQIPGLRICMGMFAACALLLGLVMSVEGHTSLALTNICGASFFIFAYYNPDALLPRNPDPDSGKRDTVVDVVQKKFLWASLAAGIIAVALEFKEYLPLG